MSKLITKDLFNSINYDMSYLKVANENKSELENPQLFPSALIIFGNSDINAAIYHLIQSLDNLEAGIATVLIQESIKTDFVQRLQSQLKPYKHGIVKSEKFVNALETIKKLNADVITAEGNVGAGPTLVCDFTHDHFGNEFTGVVTLHTFRTAKEVVSLVGKESLTFSSISIFSENHAYAYELVAALKSSNFFINCYKTPLAILEDNISEGKSYVVMDKNYHYETMPHNGVQKTIVFPIGSIFAN